MNLNTYFFSVQIHPVHRLFALLKSPDVTGAALWQLNNMRIQTPGWRGVKVRQQRLSAAEYIQGTAIRSEWNLHYRYLEVTV